MSHNEIRQLLFVFMISLTFLTPVIFIYTVRNKKDHWHKYYMYGLFGLICLVISILTATGSTYADQCEARGGCWNKEMRICATSDNGLPCDGKMCKPRIIEYYTDTK